MKVSQGGADSGDGEEGRGPSFDGGASLLISAAHSYAYFNQNATSEETDEVRASLAATAAVRVSMEEAAKDRVLGSKTGVSHWRKVEYWAYFENWALK